MDESLISVKIKDIIQYCVSNYIVNNITDSANQVDGSIFVLD